MAISFCYTATEFNVCPGGKSACTYLGPDGFGGARPADQTAPSSGVCNEYELISKSTSTPGLTTYEIACTECKAGLEAGDFFTHSNGRILPGR